jgi:hypothetical protein
MVLDPLAAAFSGESSALTSREHQMPETEPKSHRLLHRKRLEPMQGYLR